MNTTLKKINNIEKIYEIEDHGTEILHLVQAKRNNPLYKKFVKQFLNYIPIDYKTKNQVNIFTNFTELAFDFFKKKENLSKIEILQTELEKKPTTTILIATQNRSFIIDSINNLISSMLIHPLFMFYPVIYCLRNNTGDLEEIYTNYNDNTEKTGELLIFIKILENFKQNKIDIIKSQIEEIINLIEVTYKSWKSQLNKFELIINNILINKKLYISFDKNSEETLSFLKWLYNNNFTFLSTLDYNSKNCQILQSEGLKNVWKNNINEIQQIINLSKSEPYSKHLMMVGKINNFSLVHKNLLIDYILIKKINNNGEYEQGSIIFGLYGNAIYYQSIEEIPILREKMNYAINKAEFPINSYNNKKLKNIIESLPRELLIHIDSENLYYISIHILSSMLSNKLKLFMQQDCLNLFINIIIFLRREQLTPEVYSNINKYLSLKFNSTILTNHITVIAQDFTHLFITIASNNSIDNNCNTNNQINNTVSIQEIEQYLSNITSNWSDNLLHKLYEIKGRYQGAEIHKKIETKFPVEYRYKYNANIVIQDFDYLYKATKINKPTFNLIHCKNNEFLLKIYSPSTYLTLSKTLPAIENLGFIAIDSQSFIINKSLYFDKSWIYVFKLKSPIKININFTQLKTNIEKVLDKIYEGIFTSDALSKLLVLSGFTWEKVKLVKTLTRYLHQTGFIYGKGYVQLTLIKHYVFTDLLINLFDAKFNVNNQSKELANQIIKKIYKYLKQVSSSAEDKILRTMYMLIEAITRTNYYQTVNNEIKKYISIKFNSAKVPDLQLPIPAAEIFVYSNEFEGIHLQGGKVSRGGIRWTDRKEDYRTEVHKLVKAQMTKNTVIVPVGAKGTFCVNFTPDNSSNEQYMNKVIECYKDFLRGLLDLTDNLINGKIKKPEKTVIYDDDSYYLVVAADKGTSTFSDYANAVSREYKFWLDDAFASGGSDGYDHKKIGITAKGAWISVKSHFDNIGVNIKKDAIAVVGIGDMSGDVFGNGMLLSKDIKLIAAFNHKHIFIDPNPDSITSYNERKRLFNKSKSQWSDYNKEIISQGGGIFDRSQKLITISTTIKTLLNTDSTTVSPDELIKLILCTKVDLIWNGGIGTYIKASSENNIDVGDKTNDNVRCNGNEIQAKVICEGGNLGITQLGRIEYALNQGHINTDFIDNSAGVDCSDHEVNIKIALNSAISSKKINLKERNNLLATMTKQVEELVLIDNYNQNLALTIAQFTPAINIEYYSQLISEFEQTKLLNRKVEFLPSKAELTKRALSKEGMTRPELSVLLSYSKMYIEKKLLESSIADDSYFNTILYNYFPLLMQKKFYEEIEKHPLRREIIITIITNKIVNQLSGPLIRTIQIETEAKICDITKAYIVICEIFNLDKLWKQTEKLNSEINTSIKVDIFNNLTKIMRRGIAWFIKNTQVPINIGYSIKEYQIPIQKLIKVINALLLGEVKTKFLTTIKYYTNNGVDKKLAHDIAVLENIVSAFDIIYIAKITNLKNEQVAKLYFECGYLLNIDWLRKECDNQVTDSYWNKLSIQSLKDDFYDKQKRLIINTIKLNRNINTLSTWFENDNTYSTIFTSFIEDLKKHDTISLNMLILANKKFETFIRKIRKIDEYIN